MLHKFLSVSEECKFVCVCVLYCKVKALRALDIYNYNVQWKLVYSDYKDPKYSVYRTGFGEYTRVRVNQ